MKENSTLGPRRSRIRYLMNRSILSLAVRNLLGHTKPPAILYKYCTPERIDVLQNGKIRFTQPPVFNDPFESAPAFLDLISPRDLEVQLRLQAEARGMSKETLNAMLATFRSAQYRKELMKTIGPLMVDSFVRCVGLLSLTEKWDNLLMWAHYANSHEGFVIGFRTSEPFRWHDSQWKSESTLTMKVRYAWRRPKVKFLSEPAFAEMYFTKSRQWAYEQEWRMFAAVPAEDVPSMVENGLANIAESGKLPAAPDYPVRLFTFLPSAVSRIILGSRASDETSKAVAAIASQKYSNAELFKVERHPSEFRLVLRRLSK